VGFPFGCTRGARGGGHRGPHGVGAAWECRGGSHKQRQLAPREGGKDSWHHRLGEVVAMDSEAAPGVPRWALLRRGQRCMGSGCMLCRPPLQGLLLLLLPLLVVLLLLVLLLLAQPNRGPGCRARRGGWQFFWEGGARASLGFSLGRAQLPQGGKLRS